MGAILAKKIWENGHFVFSRPNLSTIITEQVNNDPTQAWLVRNAHYNEGEEAFQLTFQQPVSMINVITGVWIQHGAQGFLIDGNVADVAAKLNGCCGANATVTQNYTVLPPYQAPVAKAYSLARADDGSIFAATEAELAYLKYIIPASIKMAGWNSGTGISTYTFLGYVDPAPQGTDVITETARVFDSNSYATALSGSNVYQATVTADGVTKAVKGSTTFASLVTALQADVDTAPMGTWSTAATHVTLTTKVRDVAVIVVTQVAP